MCCRANSPSIFRGFSFRFVDSSFRKNITGKHSFLHRYIDGCILQPATRSELGSFSSLRRTKRNRDQRIDGIDRMKRTYRFSAEQQLIDSVNHRLLLTRRNEKVVFKSEFKLVLINT